MATFKALVWTRFRAEHEAVWSLCSDPFELSRALPRPLRWEISDPEGLKAAWRQGIPSRWETRLRALGRTTPWPVCVRGALDGLRFTVEVEHPAFEAWVHRRRFERAIGGHVRFVDELVVTPRKGPVAGWATFTTQVLGRQHRALARWLPADPATVGRHRWWRLEDGNLDHAEALLSGGPRAA